MQMGGLEKTLGSHGKGFQLCIEIFGGCKGIDKKGIQIGVFVSDHVESKCSSLAGGQRAAIW